MAIGAFAAANALGDQIITDTYENWTGPVSAYTHYYGAPGTPVNFNDGEGSLHAVCIGQANLQVGPYCSSGTAPMYYSTNLSGSPYVESDWGGGTQKLWAEEQIHEP